MFLEYCVKSYLKSKPISHVLAHIDDDKTKPVISLPWYDQGEDEIVSDIQKKLKELYDRHSDIQSKITETFWNNDKAFQKIGLRPYFQKLDFVGLYELKNALYRIDITFELNDDVRKIFIEKVKDDWGNEIDQFQDVTISYQGEGLFASTTHEDYYYYNKKRLNEIKKGLKLE